MSTDSDAINRIAQYASAVNSVDLDRWIGTLTDDIVFLRPILRPQTRSGVRSQSLKCRLIISHQIVASKV
jgi:ketosteroid isomerase-like protein